MRNILRNYLVNILLIVGFTALALWLVLKDDFAAVIASIAQVDLWRLLVVVASVLAFQLIIGWILQQFAKEEKPDYTLWQGFINALVAAFFHGITPSATGGQFAQVYVFHKQGLRSERAASILILDFIVNSVVLVAIALIMLVLRYHYFAGNSFFLVSLAGFLVNLGFVVFMSLCAFSPKVYTWISQRGLGIGVRLHLVKDREKALKSLNSRLQEFGRGVESLRHNKRLLAKVTTGNIVRMLLYFSIPMICAWALRIKVNDWLTVMALSSFVTNVNTFIPIPGASGGTESAFVLMFSEIMTHAEASSMMVLWRFCTFHLIMIIGAATFIRVQNSKTIGIKDPDEEKKAEEILEKGEHS